MQLSEDQIIKLAPDAASVKPGRDWPRQRNGCCGERVTGRYGGIVREVVRIPTRRRSICRISLSNVRVPAISFLVNIAWGFYFYMLLSRFIHDRGRTRLGEGVVGETCGKSGGEEGKADKPVDVEAQRRGRRLDTKRY